MSDKQHASKLSISLPRSQKDYLERRAVETGCATTASEYLRRLIHADQVAQERAALERRILERMEQPSTPMTDRDWTQIRTEVRRRLQSSKRRRVCRDGEG